jgi:hypothetical protein
LNKENKKFPTPYDDINAFLQTLQDNVQFVLGDFFVGMYLFGSLASGDFDPRRSDIDPLIVTSSGLPVKLISKLKIMHKHIYKGDSEWAKKMSGAYIPLNEMRRYNPAGPPCPLFNRDEFIVARPDIDWVIHRYVLYRNGITMFGPALKDIIDPVTPQQLQEAVLILLRNNWIPWVEKPDIFYGEGHQPFIVLTMCRALYTLKHCDVVSKQQSAKWVLANSDRKWSGLIKQAMAWHYGESRGDIGQTQQFMKYVLKEAGL